MTKRARQGRILDLIRNRQVGSQEELASLLRQESVEVTQSTLSRDIRELGLVKVRGSYYVPGEAHSSPPDEMVRRAFAQFVIQSDVSGNIIMIRTAPGNAHSIGAVLDAAQWPEILGTVAGDDTIFVLIRNGHAGKTVLKKIREFSA
jgi:transcriptional regulator of arginine metabolism